MWSNVLPFSPPRGQTISESNLPQDAIIYAAPAPAHQPQMQSAWVINETALGVMDQSFSHIQGVPESIEILRNPNCQNFHLFFFLQNLFNCYAVLTHGQEYMTCLVIHQTKPECVGIHHAKGLWDWSKYKGDTRYLKCHTNFWTHCSVFLLFSIVASGKCAIQ